MNFKHPVIRPDQTESQVDTGFQLTSPAFGQDFFVRLFWLAFTFDKDQINTPIILPA